MWKCYVCNRKMHKNNRQSHLKGQRHRKNLEIQGIKPEDLETREENYTFCSKCDIYVPTKILDQHRQSHVIVSTNYFPTVTRYEGVDIFPKPLRQTVIDCIEAGKVETVIAAREFMQNIPWVFNIMIMLGIADMDVFEDIIMMLELVRWHDNFDEVDIYTDKLRRYLMLLLFIRSQIDDIENIEDRYLLLMVKVCMEDPIDVKGKVQDILKYCNYLNHVGRNEMMIAGGMVIENYEELVKKHLGKGKEEV